MKNKFSYSEKLLLEQPSSSSKSAPQFFHDILAPFRRMA